MLDLFQVLSIIDFFNGFSPPTNSVPIMDSTMSESREGDDGWETVVSKKTKKMQRRHARQQERFFQQRDRDVDYLRSHHGFQRCRLRLHLIEEILDSLEMMDIPIERTWIVGGDKQCRGHIFGWMDETVCGECKTLVSGNTHCCCSDETKKLLPKNFYFGFEGSVSDYVRLMC